MIALWIGAAWAAPSGWTAAGEGYTVTHSPIAHHGEKSALLSAPRGTRSFGTLFQDIDPRDYLGKRIRLTLWMRSKDVKGWAGAWMRVDRGTEEVAFDNMQDRAIEGTTEWAAYTVVLDVPAGATTIVYGGLLSGSGSLWMDAMELTVVDETVPVTDMLAQRPKTRNFDFEE